MLGVGFDMKRSCIVMALVATLASLSASPLAADVLSVEDEYSAQVEAEMMASFDAGAESKQPPKRGELVSGLDLAGEWSTPGGYDLTKLTFVPLESGGYSVRFETAGCLGSWHFERKADYSGHTVILDLPVQEYSPATYTLLHTIRYRGNTYLVPSARVADFDGELGADDQLFDTVLLYRDSDGGN